MQKERQDMYTLGTRRSILVELEIKEGNTFVPNWGQTLKFDSLTSCVEYLRGVNLIIKRDTLTKYIKNEKVFQSIEIEKCRIRNGIVLEDVDENYVPNLY